MINKIIEAVAEVAADKEAKERIEKIKFKSQFRAPEAQGQTLLDLAMVMKRSMPGVEIAEVLARLTMLDPKVEVDE